MTSSVTNPCFLSVLIRPCRLHPRRGSTAPPADENVPAVPGAVPRGPRYAKKPQKICVFENDYFERDPAEYSRRNGFELPLNFYQILSWNLLGLDIVAVYLLILSSFPSGIILPLSIVYALITLCTFYTAYVVTRSDPSDRRLDANWLNHGSWDPAADEGFCDLCGPIHPFSKHCRACNKCIEGFDHHCKWLNNCIGQHNYKWFLAVVVCVACITLVSLVANLLAIFQQVLSQAPKTLWTERIPSVPFYLFWVVAGVIFFLNIPLFILDAQLLLFHLYLIFRGMSTPEYINNQINRYNAQSNQPKEQCCADWIVVDKKRLRRARAKFKRAGPTQVSEQETSQVVISTMAEN